MTTDYAIDLRSHLGCVKSFERPSHQFHNNHQDFRHSFKSLRFDSPFDVESSNGGTSASSTRGILRAASDDCEPSSSSHKHQQPLESHSADLGSSHYVSNSQLNVPSARQGGSMSSPTQSNRFPSSGSLPSQSLQRVLEVEPEEGYEDEDYHDEDSCLEESEWGVPKGRNDDGHDGSGRRIVPLPILLRSPPHFQKASEPSNEPDSKSLPEQELVPPAEQSLARTIPQISNSSAEEDQIMKKRILRMKAQSRASAPMPPTRLLNTKATGLQQPPSPTKHLVPLPSVPKSKSRSSTPCAPALNTISRPSSTRGPRSVIQRRSNSTSSRCRSSSPSSSTSRPSQTRSTAETKRNEIVDRFHTTKINKSREERQERLNQLDLAKKLQASSETANLERLQANRQREKSFSEVIRLLEGRLKEAQQSSAVKEMEANKAIRKLRSELQAQKALTQQAEYESRVYAQKLAASKAIVSSQVHQLADLRRALAVVVSHNGEGIEMPECEKNDINGRLLKRRQALDHLNSDQRRRIQQRMHSL